MVFTQVKYLKPQKMRLDKVRLELLNELRKEGNIAKKEYEKTVSTWSDKPTFEVAIGLTRKDATVLVGPTGDRADVYTYLDFGTKTRWALMSNDWKSKTKVRSFSSGRGSGHVVIAGKRAMQRRGIGPRPGIKAREWTETLNKRRKRPFTKAIISAKNRGLAKLY